MVRRRKEELPGTPTTNHGVHQAIIFLGKFLVSGVRPGDFEWRPEDQEVWNRLGPQLQSELKRVVARSEYLAQLEQESRQAKRPFAHTLLSRRLKAHIKVCLSALSDAFALGRTAGAYPHRTDECQQKLRELEKKLKEW